MDSNKYILITVSIMVIALLVGAVFTPIVSSSTTRTFTTEIENETPDFLRFGYATTDPYEFDVSIDGESTTVGGQTGGTHDMLVLATENVAIAIVDDSLIVSDGETNTNLGTSASVVRNASGLTINGESYTPGAWSYYPKANGTYAHFSHADLNTNDKPWVAWSNFAGVFTFNDRDTPDVGLVMDATVTDGVIEGVNWAKPSEEIGDLEPIEDIHITPLDPSIIDPIDLDPEPDASVNSVDPSTGTRIGNYYYTFSGTNATVIGWWSGITDWTAPIPDTVENGGTTYTVTSIGNNAFASCTNLALTSLPDGVTSIDNNAFASCTNLALTSLPSGLRSIGGYAFDGCTNLALTSLPDGVTSIDNGVFSHCTNLALTSLPSGVTSIGSNTFNSCTNLALTSLPDGVTSIGNGAFSRCTNLALTSLPSGVTSIGSNTFNSCTNLALTSLPDGVTSIGNNAFEGCTNLALTSLPSGVTSIGNNAFYGCTNLALTSLPDGVTSIGQGAFRQCTSIDKMVIYGNSALGSGVFQDCTFTGLVIVGNPTFSTTNIGSFESSAIMEVLNLGDTEITPTTSGLDNAEVRNDIDALGYVAPLSTYKSEQVTIESPTTDVLMILPLLAGVGVLMIGVGVYISRKY